MIEVLGINYSAGSPAKSSFFREQQYASEIHLCCCCYTGRFEGGSFGFYFVNWNLLIEQIEVKIHKLLGTTKSQSVWNF